jgi:hypothetical protein
VGSTGHQGLLGSDPGRKMAQAGFVEMGWARSAVETGRLGGIRPAKIFPFQNSFSIYFSSR